MKKTEWNIYKNLIFANAFLSVAIASFITKLLNTWYIGLGFTLMSIVFYIAYKKGNSRLK